MTDTTACSCCGEERAPEQLARLQCHDDIAVCTGCVGWLGEQVHARAVPILPVRDLPEALAFWTAAGFEPLTYDDGYAFIHRDDAEIVHLAVSPDLDADRNPSACYVFDRRTDRWHAEWQAAGLPVGPLETMPWGMVEFRVSDPSGNVVRVGRSAHVSVG